MQDYRKLALVYLAIPAIIFLYGWYTPWLALPICLGLLYCICILPSFRVEPLPKQLIAILALIILAWVTLSGIGGFVYQNFDHPYRNAILRDLVDYDWPVIYNDSTAEGGQSLLCYYFAYWLPAAIVGKLAGLEWAQRFLFLWSAIGVLLFLRILTTLHPKRALALLLFLCICSGADIIPYAVTHLDSIRPWSHMEWYCSWQYSSPTTCLFWVYNQTIPAWICAALLLCTQLKLAQKVFISSLLFCFSPFPFIGFVLYVAIEHCVIIAQRMIKTRSVSQCISDELHELFLHRQWLYCCVGCIFAYMTASFMGCTGRNIEVFFLHRFSLFRYLIFCLAEFAIPCLLMLKYRYKVREVSVIIGILATLPFFQIISFGDYVMRVSIIPLLMMYVFFFSFITANLHRKVLVTVCLIYIALGAFVPLSEMLRPVKHAITSDIQTTYIEDLKSHRNFNSKTYQQSLYAKWLMR